jgi:hypothetical protein
MSSILDGSVEEELAETNPGIERSPRLKRVGDKACGINQVVKELPRLTSSGAFH